MTAATPPASICSDPTDTLREIEQRVLWLSTAIVHHANRIRPNPTGLKVGGHQASCASMASIMTSLWFQQLQSGDRVSVKPHASPVLHAINYLFGQLDEKYLTSLREFGGLQSYPSRSKDPDPVDYSTGSVGIGATAPIWGAIARRYVNSAITDTGRGRQYSLVGDAELDEGAVWEAILDPSVGELGEIVWIIDLNRQSLDRVVPNIAAGRLEEMFAAAGWQVITVNFGKLLEELFTRPGGAALRHSHPGHAQPRIPAAAALQRKRTTNPPARSRDTATAIADAGRRARRPHAATRHTQPRRPRSRRRCAQPMSRSTTPGPPSSSPTPSRVTACRPKAIRRTTPSLLTVEQFDELAAALGMDPRPAVGSIRRRDSCGTAVHADRRRGCTDTDVPLRCTATGSDRYRAHPVRHIDHAGRAGPRSAGSDP